MLNEGYYKLNAVAAASLQEAVQLHSVWTE